MVDDKRIQVNAFIIMSNHVHIIWQPLQHYTLTQIQTAFMTYAAKEIKKKLQQEKPHVLETLKVNKYDRKYQVWKREPLSIELFTEKAFSQKLHYIHNNVMKQVLMNLRLLLIIVVTDLSLQCSWLRGSSLAKIQATATVR